MLSAHTFIHIKYIIYPDYRGFDKVPVTSKNTSKNNKTNSLFCFDGSGVVWRRNSNDCYHYKIKPFKILLIIKKEKDHNDELILRHCHKQIEE